MFIDWVPLLLLNAMIGYVLLAAFVYRGLGDDDRAKWSPGFLMVGTVSLIFGGLMAVHWPLPGPYNALFGETSVLLGITFLGAGLAMAKGWSLATVTWYGFFAGLGAVIIGYNIFRLHLTADFRASGVGFVLSGLAGLLAPLGWYARSHKSVRLVGALLLLGAAFIWANVVYREYRPHMQMWEKWTPQVMEQTPPAPPASTAKR